jgi:iron-sulfur cluster assembly accessory protein
MSITGNTTEPKQFDPKAIDPATPPLEVVVSPAAARHLLAQLRSQGKAFLRLGVKESGCNGYSYFLDWLDAPGADDVPLRINTELTVHIAAADQSLVHGTQVDYIREGLNATLQFKNANATGYCGCGESFSLAS